MMIRHVYETLLMIRLFCQQYIYSYLLHLAKAKAELWQWKIALNITICSTKISLEWHTK
jgi:hypothetical protein